MTREETKQYLEILKISGIETMEAFAAGETVQFRVDGDHKWIDTPDPKWYFKSGQYRVKPKPKWRPYNSMFEFAKEMVKPNHDTIVSICDNSLWFTIEAIDTKTVTLLGKANLTIQRSYQELLDDYEWGNGTPCGILEKEDNE